MDNQKFQNQTSFGQQTDNKNSNKQADMKNDTDKNKTEQDVAKKKAEDVNGNLTYDDSGIQKIIGIALKEVDGLLSINGGFFSDVKNKLVNSDDATEGINTEVGKKQVAVDLDIVAEYGKNINDINEKMKEVIANEVKKMTDLDVIEVNVNVADIKTREEFEADKETLQDKLSQNSDDKKSEDTNATVKAEADDNNRVE